MINIEDVAEIIKSMSEPQKKDIVRLHDWCKTLTCGGSGRTGKVLQRKGLAVSTGEFYNYVDHIRITELGIKVAEELIRIEDERMVNLRAAWAARDRERINQSK